MNIPGVKHSECTVGGHVVKTERLTEQLKEGARSVIAEDVVFTRTLGSKVKPRELFTGRKVNFETDYVLGFGDYEQAYNPNVTKNTMEQRTEGCIALYLRGNLAGSWNLFNLRTEKIVSRDRWVVCPTPDVVIQLMNRAAAEDSVVGDENNAVFTEADVLPRMSD
jgi:hypothetical protein